MAPAAVPAPDDPDDVARWRTVGDRIQNLLDASASDGAGAAERAEQLVREVIDLYGAGLRRLLRIATAADPHLADRIAADDLLASLLLVHGLHPHSVQRRVADALDSVRPYLGSHGGDVDLIAVDGPVVRLRFAGSCKGCPSSAATLELAIDDAIKAAAPEISSIELVVDDAQQLIPAQSLLARVRTTGHAWQLVPELDGLGPGEVGGFDVAGTPVLVCRIGEDFLAYHDRCPQCTCGMAGATLAGAVLHRPRCGCEFDVVRAGRATSGAADHHLEPIPVLRREGMLSMAVTQGAASTLRRKPRTKDEAIAVSLIGTHAVVEVAGGEFVSLLEPPADAAAAVSQCHHHRCFPVLAGPAGEHTLMLVSPIILYDHPQIAEQSEGALYDSTEIDEILTLRIMAMTDDEKAQARATDPRAAAIVDRCDSMSPEAMLNLHGVLRNPHAMKRTPGLIPEVPDGVDWWDPMADKAVDPAGDAVLVNGVRVGRGSRVRLHPTRRADAQDLFFDNRTARVTSVHEDIDGGHHVGVVLDDDPAADLHESYGRYLYFAPEEVEPLVQ